MGFKTALHQLFIGIKKGMSLFGENISTLVNSSLLTFVYIIGVGFSWLIANIVGKQFLDTHISKKKETYWKELGLKKRPLEEHYRQF